MRDTDRLFGEELSWKSAYVTGFAAIDGAHQRIFTHLNELRLVLDTPGARMASQMGVLRDEVAAHFVAEERILSDAGIGQSLKTHHQEHANLAKVLGDACQYCERQDARPDIAQRLFRAIERWLVQEIAANDLHLLRQGA